MTKTITGSVALSEDQRTATIRTLSQSSPIVSGVLGVEIDPDGCRVVYLDRRIHTRGSVSPQGWRTRGAITSILTEVKGE